MMMEWTHHEICLELLRHNARWQKRLENWYRYNGGEWTPEVIASADLRGRMDSFLPWNEIAASLRRVGGECLPDKEWIPLVLLPGMLDSVVDFWREFPPWAGKLKVETAQLTRFFCMLADPPRYGTSVGRYPEQLNFLQSTMPACGRLLDIGCGIGLGTLEAAQKLRCESACGITPEPLEVWMASRRRLPHDEQRSMLFERFHGVKAEFRVGKADEFSVPGQFDVIVCNGLAGGRFLNEDSAVGNFLENCRHYLAENGILALANSFHEGFRKNVENLLGRAAEMGWKVDGKWRCAFLRR